MSDLFREHSDTRTP